MLACINIDVINLVKDSDSDGDRSSDDCSKEDIGFCRQDHVNIIPHYLT